MVLLTLMLPLFAQGAAAQDDADITIYCLNIGKADCIILQAGGKNYLVDAGYDYNEALLKTFIRELGITRFDGVFLTHCDKDHYGGMAALANSTVEVASWYAAGIYYDTNTKEHPLVTAAALRGQQVTWLYQGNTIAISEDGADRFTVLGPIKTDTENENNNSLVLLMQVGESRLLLCGDMKGEEEATLVMRGLIPACDVIKIGHHGDNTATGDALLARCNPKAALICTNTAEEADTPSPAVLKRLTKLGIKSYVTQDTHDALKATITNGEVSVSDYTLSSIAALPEGIGLKMDLSNDTVTITNNGSGKAVLNGLILYSTQGSDAFTLPSITLMPGDGYTVGSNVTPDGITVDRTVSKKRIWSEKKQDIAILMDKCGRILAMISNGIED